MNILITGSEGKIGKILIRELSEEYNFWRLDKAANRENENYWKVDISNERKLTGVFHEIFRISGSVDVIMHLAAESHTDAPWESILRNNIIGTKNIYECARKFEIKKIIFASTNHITGCYEKKGIPKKMINISTPVRPDGDYAVSKIFSEALAREYWELYGIRSICLRIGSVLENDNPTDNPRLMKTWLSHRDLTQIIKKSVEAPVNFGIYYAVSRNTGRFWDISGAEKELAYSPRDNAAKFNKSL